MFVPAVRQVACFSSGSHCGSILVVRAQSGLLQSGSIGQPVVIHSVVRSLRGADDAGGADMVAKVEDTWGSVYKTGAM